MGKCVYGGSLQKYPKSGSELNCCWLRANVNWECRDGVVKGSGQCVNRDTRSRQISNERDNLNISTIRSYFNLAGISTSLSRL